LVYRDCNETLRVEITTAYYDQEDASILWRLARGDGKVPPNRSKPLDAPDERLVADVNRRIREKCLGTHEAGTVFVIDVYPSITRKDEFEELKHTIVTPEAIPFAGIYVTGWFPSRGEWQGSYCCWRVR
jgi:hypothetical protein